jgi:hypothetical protein
MKLILALLACALPNTNALADGQYVQGYTRSNGTYVQGHYRSAPDNTVDNNYGTRGNVNPYTGDMGTQPRSYERPTQPSYQYQPQQQHRTGGGMSNY